MSGIDPNTILIVIVSILIALWTLLIHWFISRKKDYNEKVEKHTELLRHVYEKWAKVKLHYDNEGNAELVVFDDHLISEFWKDDSQELESSNDFRWASRHLIEKYKHIWRLWKETNKSLNKINNRYHHAKPGVQKEIRDVMKIEYPNLKETTYKVSQENCYYIDKFFDVLWSSGINYIENPKIAIDNINLRCEPHEKGKIYYYVSNPLIIINSTKNGDKDKLEKVIKSLVKNKKIQRQIEEVGNLTVQCKERIDKFKNDLIQLNDEIRHGSTLEGKCDVCSKFWKEWLYT